MPSQGTALAGSNGVCKKVAAIAYLSVRNNERARRPYRTATIMERMKKMSRNLSRNSASA